MRLEVKVKVVKGCIERLIQWQVQLYFLDWNKHITGRSRSISIFFQLINISYFMMEIIMSTLFYSHYSIQIQICCEKQSF